MEIKIREMKKIDWDSVADIYKQGISNKNASFQSEIPEYEIWDKGHLKIGRLVAVNEQDRVIGWIALSPTSSRYVYRGVVEVSIYICESSRNNNIGYKLINKVIEETEKNDIWTLQSGIFSTNEASISLHKKCGFRVIGTREKIGRDSDGIWQNTVLMERRSKIVGM